MPHFLATSAALHSLANLRLQIERVPAIDVRDPAGSTLADFVPSFSLENVTFAYPSGRAPRCWTACRSILSPEVLPPLSGPAGAARVRSAACSCAFTTPTQA